MKLPEPGQPRIDVQTVADECLNRLLSDDEIETIEDAIAERVDWFGAIEGGLRRVLHLTNAIYLSGNWKALMAGLIVMEPRL